MKNCIECGIEFYSYPKTRKRFYCSRICSKRYYARTPGFWKDKRYGKIGNEIEVICRNCGTGFCCFGRNRKKRKFCLDICRIFYNSKNYKYSAWYNSEIGRISRRLNNAKRRARKRKGYKFISAEEWFNKLKLYNFTCPRCGKMEPKIKLTIDHIIPLSKGGRHCLENVQPLCISCNSSKYTSIEFYPPLNTGQMTELYKIRRQSN